MQKSTVLATIINPRWHRQSGLSSCLRLLMIVSNNVESVTDTVKQFSDSNLSVDKNSE